MTATFFPREMDVMTMITERRDGFFETARAPRDQHENMTRIGADRGRRGMKSSAGRGGHGMKIDRFVRVFSGRWKTMRVIEMSVAALWNKHFKCWRCFHGHKI